MSASGAHANASLISIVAMSSKRRFARASARRVAGTAE
jgi:hypothetical protein